jgi:glycosyltransferase involved in cell wall biosynthesis
MHGLGMRLFVTPVFYSRRSPQRVAAGVTMAGKLRAKGGFWTEHMFCKELCDMAELVMPDTQDEMEMIAKAFGVPAQKMRELPNGVEERFYNAAPDKFVREFGIKDFLLYVGHIGPGRKNVLPMLKAAAKIGLPTVLIGPVGTNDYARHCQKIISESPNMRLIPGLPSDSPLLESAYAACDTLILPAFYETPGLAALEAALAGAKVCITRYGGTREYFADYATYLEPNSEQSILNAINESMAKPRDPALRERVRTNYLWRSAGEILAQTYRDTTES